MVSRKDIRRGLSPLMPPHPDSPAAHSSGGVSLVAEVDSPQCSGDAAHVDQKPTMVAVPIE